MRGERTGRQQHHRPCQLHRQPLSAGGPIFSHGRGGAAPGNLLHVQVDNYTPDILPVKMLQRSDVEEGEKENQEMRGGGRRSRWVSWDGK